MRCRSCRRRVLWAAVAGIRCPFDPSPSPAGYVRLVEGLGGELVAVYLFGPELVAVRSAGVPLHVGHICPEPIDLIGVA